MIDCQVSPSEASAVAKLSFQLAESQLGCWWRNIPSRGHGMGSGRLLAWGTCTKREGRSLQRMASAATFKEPTMWEALNWNENSIANRANPRKRCITNGSLLHQAVIACTTASLSHLKWTHFDFHVRPPADSTMGRSSFAVIFTNAQVSGH